MPDNEYCAVLANTQIFLNIDSVTFKGAGGVSTKSGVVATAMALGLPIVSTFGDMTDLQVFKNKENVLFVPYSNPELAVFEIQMLINNIPLMYKLANNSKITYQTKMQWSESINFYLSILS